MKCLLIVILLLSFSSCFKNEESIFLDRLIGYWVPMKNGYDVEFISFIKFEKKYYFRGYINDRPTEDGCVQYANSLIYIINEDNIHTNVYKGYDVISNILYFYRRDGITEVYKKFMQK